jgi:hypothetical protein
MGKIGIRDEEKSGSGVNIPDHFCKSLETVFKAKQLKFCDEVPRSGFRNLFDPRSGIEKFGSWINTQDPQHWRK